jgi:hypothetical protein
MATVAGTVADFIKQELEANKPAVLAAIQQAEGGVEGVIISAIEGAPAPGGILGMLFKSLRPQLEAYVKNLVATQGPEIVFDFIDGAITAEAKALGG